MTNKVGQMNDKLGQQSQEREWVGLTDEELNEHARWADEHGGTFYLAYARSIEAKLKELNHA